MLNPSYDAPKSSGTNNYLRAIENGFSMVRPTCNGYSYAIDYNGNLLASMDSDKSITCIMYADVPIQGVNTIYSTIGDLPGWTCVAGFMGFLPLNIILRKEQKEGQAKKPKQAIPPSINLAKLALPKGRACSSPLQSLCIENN